MRRVKCDQAVLRLPVFFLSLYWFLAAYVLGNLVVFLRYSHGGSLAEFIKQLLLINVTYELGALLFAYGFVLVIASLFALLTIYISPARLVILLGGSLMGVCLGIFAYGMSVYLTGQPCEIAGCGDVDYKIFIVLMIYLIYGNFVASQVPIAYALRREPCSVKEFFQVAFWPGIAALGTYFLFGLAIAFAA